MDPTMEKNKHIIPKVSEYQNHIGQIISEPLWSALNVLKTIPCSNITGFVLKKQITQLNEVARDLRISSKEAYSDLRTLNESLKEANLSSEDALEIKESIEPGINLLNDAIHKCHHLLSYTEGTNLFKTLHSELSKIYRIFENTRDLSIDMVEDLSDIPELIRRNKLEDDIKGEPWEEALKAIQ